MCQYLFVGLRDRRSTESTRLQHRLFVALYLVLTIAAAANSLTAASRVQV
jgi:hypothetical protein